MTKALVLDEVAITYLQSTDSLSHEWLDAFGNNEHIGRLRRITIGESVYVLSNRATSKSRLAVFCVDEHGLFANLVKPEFRIEAFRRALRGCLRIFDPAIAIPGPWKPYHKHGAYFSFQSNTYGTGVSARVHIDHRGKHSKHVFVYYVGESDPIKEDPDYAYSVFERAIGRYEEALSSKPDIVEKAIEPERHVLALSGHIEDEITQGLSVEQWYKTKLTAPQRRFVDSPLEHSVRLQGAAGTGKTLAMIVKCLRILHDAMKTQRTLRVAYLTHSLATADLVRNIVSSIDDQGVLFLGNESIGMTITTLQSLATNALAFDLGGLEVLSHDGLEGRKMQIELIQSLLEDYRNSDWIAMKAQCSETFQRYVEEEKGSPAKLYFVCQLMNEFACVLDAEGVRDNPDKRAVYLRETRLKWMMRLDTESERQVVLDLYSSFRKLLREMRTIGVDQIISDYARYLDGFQWDAVRQDRGYDHLFVDELHLFNRQERMLFHQLMGDPKRLPGIFMAYDVKQSPRDTFLGVSAGGAEKYNFWREAKLGKIEKIELQDVFRYTPQITAFLRAVDQSFPTLGLDEDWPSYSGISRIEDGRVPVACEVKDELVMYDVVFRRAAESARVLKKGRRVAILCCNYELFERYAIAGTHKDRLIAIKSREQLTELSFAGRRFVLSMPEFVAGLQFDTVFLIDVNNGEIPEGAGVGAVRQFVSQIYLGASRAERNLEIYASAQRGGLSRQLDHALREPLPALKRMSIAELK